MPNKMIQFKGIQYRYSVSPPEITISRHENYKYVSLNESEFRLGLCVIFVDITFLVSVLGTLKQDFIYLFNYSVTTLMKRLR